MVQLGEAGRPAGTLQGSGVTVRVLTGGAGHDATTKAPTRFFVSFLTSACRGGFCKTPSRHAFVSGKEGTAVKEGLTGT